MASKKASMPEARRLSDLTALAALRKYRLMPILVTIDIIRTMIDAMEWLSCGGLRILGADS